MRAYQFTATEDDKRRALAGLPWSLSRKEACEVTKPRKRISKMPENMNGYKQFINRKSQWGSQQGFDPSGLPAFLYDFQRFLVDWALRQGRAAIFADCGLGKTPMQLTWAQKVIEHTNKSVLIATPLAVSAQTLREADKFGFNAKRSRDGSVSGSPRIWVTNYEQLHKFDASQFAGMVADESSCIKDFKTQRKASVVEFMRTIPYRLLCTATAAPNDYWELGTSSEALGMLGFRDMITTFFKQETSKDHLGWGRTKYRFRGHAEQPFWSWVCSWARSCRKPSDLGFCDEGFELPPLLTNEHVVKSSVMRDGMLFAMPPRDMREEREERRNSLQERCDKAAAIAHESDCSAVWCELNAEGDALSKRIDDCVQVSGSMTDEAKEEALLAFTNGQVKRLVTKPKIGAWGLNWQHCSNVVMFPTHSFEQYYQAVRRCYRFGQEKSVTVDLVLSEGERGILDNLKRKHQQTEKMFTSIVSHMGDSMRLVSDDYFPESEDLPKWL